MNILIIGSGAREHAIAKALQRSRQYTQLFCCGTSVNPALQALTHQYVVVDITDVASIKALALKWNIHLAIIGPEAPLSAGLADAFWQHCIPTIGPKKELAQIETSKSFARTLMQKYNIPGVPLFQVFADETGLQNFLQTLGENNYVIKANGLMGGKGVKVAGEHLHSFTEALQFCREIFTQKQTVVVEQKLIGQEFSLMCFCDGEHLQPMPLVQDHKRAFVNDEGPNTGGMGSYSDADHSLPFLSSDDVTQALRINQAIIRALKAEVHDRYIGILYGSFIATQNGLYVIEFNARFGDPEALNVLTLLESDFVALCRSMIMGTLAQTEVRFAQQATVCKYRVPEGYPHSPRKNVPIDISAVKNKSYLYLAAVDSVEGLILTTGSRTAAYVGVADTIWAAEAIAETEVRAIDGPLFHRADIGTRKLIEQRILQMQKLKE